MAKTQDDAPVHPIIERPHEYEIVRLDYVCDPAEFRHSYLDLWLRRNDTLRRLRFLRPQSLKIEDGCLTTHGMTILDISNRQWDDLRVEVADFEASPGGITFYAADVIDLDAEMA